MHATRATLLAALLAASLTSCAAAPTFAAPVKASYFCAHNPSAPSCQQPQTAVSSGGAVTSAQAAVQAAGQARACRPQSSRRCRALARRAAVEAAALQAHPSLVPSTGGGGMYLTAGTQPVVVGLAGRRSVWGTPPQSYPVTQLPPTGGGVDLLPARPPSSPPRPLAPALFAVLACLIGFRFRTV